MNIVFWVAFAITVAEFIASPVNTLMNSKMHLQRLKEVHFPISIAKALAVIELVAVAAVIAGIWFPLARRVGGITLAACFLPILAYALRARRPAGDILGLLFFMACATISALY